MPDASQPGTSSPKLDLPAKDPTEPDELAERLHGRRDGRATVPSPAGWPLRQ